MGQRLHSHDVVQNLKLLLVMYNNVLPTQARSESSSEMSDSALRDLVSRLVQEEGDLGREDVDALCVMQVLDKQICNLISKFCAGLVGTTDLEVLYFC